MLNQMLNIKYPIIQGAMANIATAEFAAAVSNCGGLGVIGTGAMNVEQAREAIHTCKKLTDKPFGVNVMMMNPYTKEIMEMIAEEKVALVTTGAGNPGVYMEMLKASGAKVFPVVPSVALAIRMERSGADGVIVEGGEAGGHVGEQTTMALVPQVVDAVNIPVVAAGGIADGRGFNAAISLGAQGVQIGTCLLVAKECPIHENYKNAVIKAKDTDTVVTGRSLNSPVRILKNKMSRQYIKLEQETGNREEMEKLTLGALRKAVFDGDMQMGSVMMGQIAGLCKEIKPMQQILDEMMEDSKKQLKALEVKLGSNGMLETVVIGNKTLEVPIIQGGMGVGISLGNLAGHVMKENGMGVISAAHPGYLKPYFKEESMRNCEAIKEEAGKARTIAEGKGLLGVNIMVASKDYASYVKAAIEANVDAIISGAGLPLELPSLAKGSDVLLAPIVSSAKAMKLILKMWDRRHECTPDFVVVESSEAGGHLGFKKDDLLKGTCESLSTILKGVLEELQPYRKKYGKAIPVFVAGGIYSGEDIASYIKQGANGVQMGTRFIATEECDADIRFKEAIVNCKKEEIGIVKSPTGFPGRGLFNDFIKRSEARGNIAMKHCLNCMLPCTPENTPYCISQALIQSAKGNLDNGLVFAGSNAWRINKIVSVHTLMEELKTAALAALEEK